MFSRFGSKASLPAPTTGHQQAMFLVFCHVLVIDCRLIVVD